MKNNKKTAIIAIALVMAIAVMGFGFAAWQTELNATGTVRTDAVWDVRFEALDAKQTFNASWTANNDPAISTTKTTADTLDLGNISISQPGGYVVLDVTVKNYGNIDADLSEMTFVPAGDAVPAGFTIKVIDEFTAADDPILKAKGTCKFSILVQSNYTCEEEQFQALNPDNTQFSGASQALSLKLVYIPTAETKTPTTQHSHAA